MQSEIHIYVCPTRDTTGMDLFPWTSSAPVVSQTKSQTVKHIRRFLFAFVILQILWLDWRVRFWKSKNARLLSAKSSYHEKFSSLVLIPRKYLHIHIIPIVITFAQAVKEITATRKCIDTSWFYWLRELQN